MESVNRPTTACAPTNPFIVSPIPDATSFVNLDMLRCALCMEASILLIEPVTSFTDFTKSSLSSSIFVFIPAILLASHCFHPVPASYGYNKVFYAILHLIKYLGAGGVLCSWNESGRPYYTAPCPPSYFTHLLPSLLSRARIKP
ncbi:hypothetical protein Barb6_03341 [Bacteroidales bacterium Barb6]|nr:hypothetical protein Barb6_03341 [Bacteroidales bacterium Barb6]OAV64646.1 hypothetical protein Barb4_03922 [Bacteroidales bacterium Barb4]